MLLVNTNQELFNSIKPCSLRFTRNIEDTARADSLGKDLSDGTIDGFWENVRKLNSGNSFKANTIDGVSGETDITFGRTIYISC